MTIEPGRLQEGPCPHCGHMEHRAFGEFEAPRGELASYAFGWTSGHEQQIGRMTIGIGAGNPGGASFHLEVGKAEDETALRLVDDPFERVPEGGPDLTREQALAHPDLQFIWYVADEIARLDRRYWWMEHWIWGTRAFATQAVVDGALPVLHVVRDSDDGEWQLLDGRPGSEETAVLFHLHHALDRDRTLLDVLDLAPGQRADRAEAGDSWARTG
jgi:hypothetical protein